MKFWDHIVNYRRYLHSFLAEVVGVLMVHSSDETFIVASSITARLVLNFTTERLASSK